MDASIGNAVEEDAETEEDEDDTAEPTEETRRTAGANYNTFELYRGVGHGTFYLPGWLSANENFRKQYCTTMMDIANTTYSYDRVHRLLKEWEEALSTQAEENTERFYGSDSSDSAFRKACEHIDTFFRYRRDYIEQYLREDENLEGDIVPVSVAADGIEDTSAAIRVNSSLLKQEEVTAGWTGEYFSDFPITLSVENEDDDSFDHWEIRQNGESVTETETFVTLDLSKGAAEVRAVFSED